MPLHVHAWEQQAEVEGHHLLQRHGRVNGFGLLAAQVGRDLDEAGQVFLRHLHPGKFLLTRIGVAHQGGHVEAQVADEGKGVGGIHRQGGENRENGVLEVGVEPIALGTVEVGVVGEVNAVVAEMALKGVAVVLLLHLQQGAQLGANRLQLLLGGESVITESAHPRIDLGLQRGHPHHEEFIEVVAEDGAELRLLK